MGGRAHLRKEILSGEERAPSALALLGKPGKPAARLRNADGSPDTVRERPNRDRAHLAHVRGAPGSLKDEAH
eukprot:8903754-Alexandrium_andersonii.AAC.1